MGSRENVVLGLDIPLEFPLSRQRNPGRLSMNVRQVQE